MATNVMREIVVERPEFLVLLDAVHADVVVGIDRSHLVPDNQEERAAMLRQGMVSLERRGLLRVVDQQTYAIEPHLQALMQVIAYPALAVAIERDVLGEGPQLFLHYEAQDFAVEQTFPREGVHRLAALGDIPAMLQRADYILGLPDVVASPRPISVDIDQDSFFQVRELVRQGARDRALTILGGYGVAQAEATVLLDALAQPTFIGNIALLQCRGQTITDGRNVLLVRDARVAWRAAQLRPGELRLRVQTTSAADMNALLAQYVRDLIA